MSRRINKTCYHKVLLLVLSLFGLNIMVSATASTQRVTQRVADRVDLKEASMQVVVRQLEVGDVIFIRLSNPLFMKVADVTQSWTNHVGVVVDISGKEPMVAESRFPFSLVTSFSKFVDRSEGRRIAVRRLNTTLSIEQKQKISIAANKRLGKWYDLGFDLYSENKEFCSRYVYEVLAEATDIKVGKIETFSTLLGRNPDTKLTFWKVWYLGQIPWTRKTLTPASVLQSNQLKTLFDGNLKY